jgi:hypothetical protein
MFVLLKGSTILRARIEELHKGAFCLCRERPGDLNLVVYPRRAVKWICCDVCRDFHGFIMGDVVWDELKGLFRAPSKERLREALQLMEFTEFG